MKYYIFSKSDEISKNIETYIKNKILLPFDNENPNIVIAVGGDGTFISAVHKYPNAIIFGLHTGHLGFYSNYTTSDVDILIEDINNNSFKYDSIDLIKCEINTTNDTIIDYAVNEMTIIMPPRTLILDVCIDDKKLETYRGTGFCISTPYGSTAYNKSLHGAVVDPEISCFQMTEIAGINSNSYRTLGSPLLLSAKRTITLNSLKPESIYITIDNISYTLNNFEFAKVQLADMKIKVAYHNKPYYIDRLKRTFLEE